MGSVAHQDQLSHGPFLALPILQKCILHLRHIAFHSFQNHISHFLFFDEIWTRRPVNLDLVNGPVYDRFQCDIKLIENRDSGSRQMVGEVQMRQ